MGFNWFWDRVSEKWVVSTQAAWLFGFSAVLICFFTGGGLGLIKKDDPPTGVVTVLWGIAGVLGGLSVPFIWGGMRKFQDMRDVRWPGKTRRRKFIRLAMVIGLCYTSIIYYLVVYLPGRSRILRVGVE